MREAVYRFTAPLLARIPDLSGQPRSRQAAIGIAASIAVHLLILLLMLILALVLPSRVDQPPSARKDLEIQLVPMPPKKETKAAEKAPVGYEVLDPRGLQAAKEKPKDPKFESDRDMVAGSEAPPSGLLPLPSQEAQSQRDTHDFATQDVQLGVARPPAPAAPPAPASTEPPQPAQPPAKAPSLPPLYDPHPVAKEKLDAAEHAKPDQPLPEPARKHEIPPDLKAVATPQESEMAVAKPSPVATPAPLTKVVPPVQYTTAALATPKPFPGSSYTQRYQEDLKKTRVEGSISNKGRPGADAIATPLGRYFSQVKVALFSSWKPLVDQRRSLIIPGSTTFSFTITSAGHIAGLRMESNTSNSSFANLCEEAIRRAPIPPPPVDLVPSLRDGGLEYPMTFTLYDY